ncbi:hypothetical protein [Chitinasiproducens palmae]|uniref:hypothetical protein n=1 Tax=Chitinasiproducens palmae TaxID=1770053 RepID=UPI000B84E2CF|nr:hypothetical protein [Chitinasiproducens palmae]
MQEHPQTRLGTLQIADFALPQLKNLPARFQQSAPVPMVSTSIRFDFWRPLAREAVVAKNATTAGDGKTYQVEFYNLAAIISAEPFKQAVFEPR